MLPGYLYQFHHYKKRIKASSSTILSDNEKESLITSDHHEQQQSYPIQSLIKIYIGMGIVVCGVTFFRSYGVSYLPGSQASILLATSIIFNMILSYFILKKI